MVLLRHAQRTEHRGIALPLPEHEAIRIGIDSVPDRYAIEVLTRCIGNVSDVLPCLLALPHPRARRSRGFVGTRSQCGTLPLRLAHALPSILHDGRSANMQAGNASGPEGLHELPAASSSRQCRCRSVTCQGCGRRKRAGALTGTWVIDTRLKVCLAATARLLAYHAARLEERVSLVPMSEQGCVSECATNGDTW